jgi:photosystem II stability/assembly factor-like uncharacterized protein
MKTKFLTQIVILFLISIHLYSKEYGWVLVDNEDNPTPYSYTSATVKNSSKLICGGNWNIVYPFIKYSYDGGLNWNMVLKDSNYSFSKFPKKMYVSFIFLGENNEALAFLDSGYVYRTVDMENWERKQLKFTVSGITQDAKQYKNTILVSTFTELYKSTDFGKTWTDIYSHKQDTNNIIGIARLEVINENTYYATYFYDKDGLTNTYLMKTVDGGENWETLTQLPSYFQQIDFIDENTGYGHWTTNNGKTQNIFKTVDGGKNWDLIYQKHFQYYNIIVSMNVYSKDTILFVSSNKELYKTNNDFNTVELDSAYITLNFARSVCPILIDGNKIFNPALNNRIFLYTDEVGVCVEDLVDTQINNGNSFIYPNPSSEKVSLDLGGVAVAVLVVYDILGNVIMSIPNYKNKNEIDISNLSMGTYTIQVQSSTGSISQKLLVNR